jgi:hypothetical protein
MREVEERPTFVVGSNSDPVAIREAVEGLKKMVEAGKEAQRALDALEQDGHYDRPVRWLYGDNNYIVRRDRFPRYEPISPDDLPMVAELWLELLPGVDSQYGGHPCREYPLALRGNRLVFEKSRTLRQQPIENCRIGFLRISKNTMSWARDVRRTAFLVLKKCKTIETAIAQVRDCEAVGPLGTTIGRNLVVLDPTCRHNSGFSLNQKARDLRDAAEKWIVEQGHAARMLEDVVRAAWVEMIMAG